MRFGTTFAVPAILAERPRFLPFWQSSCHLDRTPTMGGSPLPSEGGYFLTRDRDRLILRPQSLYPLATTRLAHLDDHRILTPTIAGINLFLDRLGPLTHSLSIEPQNLFAADHAAIDGRLVARNRDSREAKVRLTLDIFDHGESVDHFGILWCEV